MSANAKSFLEKKIWENNIFTGEWVKGSDTFISTEPATGESLGSLGKITASELASITKQAAVAQKEWAKTAYETRIDIMKKAANCLQENREEIVKIIMQESGGIRPKAEFEIGMAIKILNYSATMPYEAQGHILPSEHGKISLAKRVPVGVVGVISPFNFPLLLSLRAVAPAIAVGNAAVLKPDPQTTICSGVVIARAFEEAGLPKGIFNLVSGGGDVGQAICKDPTISMVQFTGSTRAGKEVGKTCGENLKKVSLELGGKNSLIIRADADMDIAIKNATWGSFLHQGQICMATGKILVHSSIVQEFTKRLAEHASRLPCGNPLTEQVALGPLINATQVKNVERIIEQSVTAGAKIEAGGTSENLFVKPTVLSGVKPGMACYEEEIFGPVASIISYDTDDEAIAYANDTEYGLSSAIISKDIGKALEMGEQIHSGLFHVNDQTVNDEVVNPFGGVGKSGNGNHIGGAANWEDFTHWRWITIKSEAPAYPL